MNKHNPIKILHLRSSGGLYGAESVILNLSREGRTLGTEHEILCLNNNENPHTELVDEALKHNIKASSVNCQGIYDKTCILAIRKKIIEEGHAIIHSHDYKANFYAHCATYKLPVKKIATNHLWTRASLKLRLYEFFDGLLLNEFDAIVAVSEKIADEVKVLLRPTRKNRLSIIPNGIDLSRFDETFKKKIEDKPLMSSRARKGVVISNKDCHVANAPRNDSNRADAPRNDKEKPLVISNIARLSLEKGQAWLLYALKILIEKNGLKNIQLQLIGDGPEHGNLIKLCKELGLDFYEDFAPSILYPPFSIIFTGPRNDIPNILSATDIFILPSRREGLPMAMLEAMAAGVPVIASSVGEIPKIITHNITGFLLPSRNPAVIADTLNTVISQISHNDPNIQDIIHAARHCVEDNYSALSMARKYEEVYRNLENR